MLKVIGNDKRYIDFTKKRIREENKSSILKEK